MFGFELLFKTISSELKSKNDLLVSVLHWKCLQKGFLCVGIGENFDDSSAASESGSEVLPNGWNRSQETYVLRYVDQKSGQKLLVKCVKVSDILIISTLLVTGDNNGTTLSVKTNDYVTNDFKHYESAFNAGSVDTISQLIETQVINKMLKSTQSSAKTNETLRERSPERRSDPLREPNPSFGGPLGVGYEPFGSGQWPPPIGGSDLDPLGRRQGGMLMDPRTFPTPFGRQPRNPAPGLPYGAVPPGARFDPFGPAGVGPNPNRNPNRNPRAAAPDPDHLPPPGYDDMFM